MKLLIKDRFFHNADVLRRFALSFEYQDSSKILTDVGWRGHRTEEFDLLDNKIINEASQNILKRLQGSCQSIVILSLLGPSHL